MCNYQNSKIYKLWSPEGDDIYIGSTTVSLSRRKAKHKTQNNTSKILFEKYTDVRIELLEECPCDNKEQLLKKEGEYIRNNNCVNKRVAGRTNKEYREDNKEHLKEYYKQYREDNKEYIKEQKKEYREDNKERIKEHHKEYRENNKEKIKEHHKEYRENNKEKIKERNSIEFVCECGRTIKLNDKARHQRSKIHNDLMNELK